MLTYSQHFNSFLNFTKTPHLKLTDFIDFSFIDVVDILLVALLLFYLYKLLKGTVAINIFVGIVIIYLIWRLTDLLNMDVLSNLLGKFISVGFFALIVVFQQEIRKFRLLLGSTNFDTRRNMLRYFRFLSQEKDVSNLDFDVLVDSCEEMAKSKIIEPTTADSGALSVIFAKGFPSHSSPFLKITIGKSRLNPRFNNIFSRFGLDISADLILMGVFYMSFLVISRQ